MRTTRSLSITLPNEMAEMVKAKVASGEYASESDVISDGLRTLAERDAVIERWLYEEVAPVYDAHMADPSRAVPLTEAMAQIRAAGAVRERKG